MRNLMTMPNALLVSAVMLLSGCGGSNNPSEQQQSQSFFNLVAGYVSTVMGLADASEPEGIDNVATPMPEGLEPYDVSIDGSADFSEVGQSTGVTDAPADSSVL